MTTKDNSKYISLSGGNINPALHPPSKTPPLTHKGQLVTNLQRTKKAQEDKGRMCGIVERFVSNYAAQRNRPGIRSDLYNLFDLLSCSPKDGIIGVQACGADVRAHYRKITIEHREKALFWLASTGKIELWGWRLLVEKRGSKRRKWMPRVIAITEKDLMSQRCRQAA